MSASKKRDWLYNRRRFNKAECEFKYYFYCKK